MTISYADWTYYSTTYLGTAITQAEFAALALRASALIDIFTFGRAVNIIADDEDNDAIEAIQMATCAMADELKAQEIQPGGIASEQVGNHSISYAKTSEMQLSNHNKLVNVAKIYLCNNGLMFRGFESGEYAGDTDNDDED